MRQCFQMEVKKKRRSLIIIMLLSTENCFDIAGCCSKVVVADAERDLYI